MAGKTVAEVIQALHEFPPGMEVTNTDGEVIASISKDAYDDGDGMQDCVLIEFEDPDE